MNCGYSVKTSSGTFTVYNQLLDKCAATKFCKEKGHILAPISTLEDKEALTKLLHADCDIHKGVRHYHIGLDITPCGGGQDRVFSNGVIYDKNVHGHLYVDKYITAQEKCPLAYMHYFYSMNRLVIGTRRRCEQQPMKVLCLDQSTAASSPITQREDDHYKVSSSEAVIGLVGNLVVVGCLALVALKFYRQSKMLKTELNAVNDGFGLKSQEEN